MTYATRDYVDTKTNQLTQCFLTLQERVIAQSFRLTTLEEAVTRLEKQILQITATLHALHLN